MDEDLGSDTRPAGLIRPVIHDSELCAGSRRLWPRRRAGSATHNLTSTVVPGRRAVFGAGTVQWSWGLMELTIVAGHWANLTMQQATVNLLAK